MNELEKMRLAIVDTIAGTPDMKAETIRHLTDAMDSLEANVVTLKKTLTIITG